MHHQRCSAKKKWENINGKTMENHVKIVQKRKNVKKQ